VGLFVDLRPPFAGALEEAKKTAPVIVPPVIQVFHAVFLLGFEILFVSFYNLLNALASTSL